MPKSTIVELDHLENLLWAVAEATDRRKADNKTISRFYSALNLMDALIYRTKTDTWRMRSLAGIWKSLGDNKQLLVAALDRTEELLAKLSKEIDKNVKEGGAPGYVEGELAELFKQVTEGLNKKLCELESDNTK